MLAANKQRADIPLWITEIGFQAPIKPDAKADARQADMLVKAYVLSIAQGFERICWFEARGPAYGQGTDHGIIRADWTPRPAYDALKTMTAAAGAGTALPRLAGRGQGGYGFVFQGPARRTCWPPGRRRASSARPSSTREVRVTDLAGKESSLAAGQELALTATPVFVTELPADLAKQAQANCGKPYPVGRRLCPAPRSSPAAWARPTPRMASSRSIRRRRPW